LTVFRYIKGNAMSDCVFFINNLFYGWPMWLLALGDRRPISASGFGSGTEYFVTVLC
jgi:hypothetical protein